MSTEAITINGRKYEVNKDNLIRVSNFFRAALAGEFASEHEFIIPNPLIQMCDNDTMRCIGIFIDYVNSMNLGSMDLSDTIKRLAYLYAVLDFLQCKPGILSCIMTKLMRKMELSDLSGQIYELTTIDYFSNQVDKYRLFHFYCYAKISINDDCWFPDEFKVIWDYKVALIKVNELRMKLTLGEI